VTVPTVNRLRVLIVLLWRAGVRISERSHYTRATLDRSRGAVPRSARERRQAARGWNGSQGMGAGVRRRFAPHQLRHAHAVEMVHERVRSW
jgi:site-specific recombinase XerD